MADDTRTKIGTVPARPATQNPRGSTPAPSTGPPAGTAPPATDPPIALATEDPLVGRELAGRYQIQRKLGEGGMGAVYLATHKVLEKQIALKILHGEFARKPDLVERFMQEAKAASRIRHENVIDISDFGSTPEGLVYFAMELLQGHDLHEVVTRAKLAGQLLPWPRSKRIFLQICAALSAAHEKKIIHRDLKPENIYLIEFLGEPDFVKLLDFGIAKLTEVAEGDRKLTRTGMLFGTPEYMSPEQARGERVDHRVDIYAMGCILYQLVSGRVPFEAENFMGVLTMHLTEPPPVIPVEVFDTIGAPRELWQIIERALAKDPKQRFESVDELAREVRRASGERTTGVVTAQAMVTAPPNTAAFGRARTQWTGNLSVPPEAEPAESARPKSKTPLVLGGILAVIVLGCAIGAVAVFSTSEIDSDAAKQRAAEQAEQAELGSRAGSQTAQAGSQASAPTPPTPAPQPPVQPPPPQPPAEPPLAFEWSEVRIESTPKGAEVKDLTSNNVIGKTPFTLKLRPSRTPRQFELSRRGYVTTFVEIVPDREKIKREETLERGTGTKPAPKPPTQTTGAPQPDPQAPPGDPAPPVHPDPAPAEPATPPGKPPAEPSTANEDCGDPPCLKSFPSKTPGSGSGSAAP